MALTVAIHFLYDVFIKDYDRRIFIGDMRRELKDVLEVFRKSITEHISTEAEKSGQTIQFLERSVEKLTLTTDYMKVGEVYHGFEVTEARIYRRAIEEINKAHATIDVFTSYLLEIDDQTTEALQARNDYFSALLSLSCAARSVYYRRIIQVPKDADLEDVLGKRSDTYLEHIREMMRMEKGKKKVHIKAIDRRRPTTYVIIDNKILLWQINQVGMNGDMQVYGMYIMRDPGQIFVKHFCSEFQGYWDSEAKPVVLKTVLT